MNKKTHRHPSDIAEMSLEQIMMCVYEKPCIRMTAEQLNDTRYGYGSVLVYKDRVIIVLNPEDDTLCFYDRPHNVRYCTGKRKFKGLLPGSRFYTRHTLTVIDDPERVRELRALKAQDKVVARPHFSSLFAPSDEGKLNDHRCPEAWKLMGRRDAARLASVLAEGAD